MLGVTAIGLIPPLIVAAVIDRVVGQGRYDFLLPLMLALLLLPFADAVMRWISDYTVTVVSQRFVFDVRLDLYDHVQRLSCRYMSSTTTGKLMERLRGDVAQVQAVLTNQTLSLGVQV